MGDYPSLRLSPRWGVGEEDYPSLRLSPRGGGGGRGRGGLGAIRTIRLVILCALLRPGHRLSHDGLCRPTLFCEVECIINGRPITKVSDDVNDDVPLTPNYLLMIKKCPSLHRWVGGWVGGGNRPGRC